MENSPVTAHLFYEMMWYPAPFRKELFAYGQEIDIMGQPSDLPFSRAKTTAQMDEFLGFIKKCARLWKSLPYVDAIYLANSITFNALHDQSDIDLFIVTSPHRIWTARLYSCVMLWLLWLKRSWKHIRKRFCLSFYVTRDHSNLQSIKLRPIDPYLIYRLAHLVPIYQKLPEHHFNIYEDNHRLRDYLPTFPMEQVVHLGLPIVTGSNKFKRWIERFRWNRFGDLIEAAIKMIRVPILIRKKRRLGVVWESIIIADHMLKFHADKREKYALQRKMLLKEKMEERKKDKE